MKVFTVYCDYFATGEGRHVMAWIGPALSRLMALDKFAREFGEFYAQGATVEQGFASPSPWLFSDEVVNHAKTIVNAHGVGACPILKASMEYNLS